MPVGCRRFAPVALLLWPLAACAPYTGFAQEAVRQEYAQSIPTDLRQRTDRSVDRIVAELGAYIRNQANTPTVVGSVADIADVNHSTPLGNIIADLVRTRLVQRNIAVVDMRLRSTVELSPTQGEMVFSRNRKLVYPAPQVGMICAGTYAVAHSSVIVSLKMVDATNAQILAAADFRLPRTADVNRLLIGRIASRALTRHVATAIMPGERCLTGAGPKPRSVPHRSDCARVNALPRLCHTVLPDGADTTVRENRAANAVRKEGTQVATYNVLIMGASYGSLLASKLLFAGHNVKLVCLPAEVEAINSDGIRVRLPVKGRRDLVEVDSRKLPGKLSAAAPADGKARPTTTWSHWRCRSRNMARPACVSCWMRSPGRMCPACRS